MKKLFAIFLAALIILSAAGCSSGRAEETAPAQTAAAETAAAESTAETAAPSVPETTAETAPAETAEEKQPYGFTFRTVDTDGNPVDESLFAGHRLVMINLWEPWCGPCVREMPDLEALSNAYAKSGLLLVGVYSTEDGVKEVVSDTGVTYPILHDSEEFVPFMTDYVPTTVFLDENGNQVGETYISARSFAEWETIIEGLLK